MPADLRTLLNAATPFRHECESARTGTIAQTIALGYRWGCRCGAFPPVLSERIAIEGWGDDCSAARDEALRNAAPALLDIVEAARDLVDDTRNNVNCPVCAEPMPQHDPDCTFPPLVAALKRLETE